MADALPDPNVQTSATDERGRTLTGIGVSTDQLEATMDRHAPDPAPDEPKAAPVSGAPSAPADPSPPKLTRGQARFSELAQQRKAAEARAETAERERDELKARVVQAPPPPAQTPPAHQPQPAAPSPPQYTRPEPSEDEIGDKYATYAAFTRAQTEWVLEQQQAQFDTRMREAIAADRAAQAFTAHVEQTRTKGRAVYKDFDQVLTSGPGAFVDMPMPAIHAILQHPQSEHLQYAIMKDGAVAQRVAQLAFRDPFAFAMELTKLAPAASSNGNGNGHQQAAPPAPMTPVGSGSRATTTASSEHAEAGNYESYKLARAAERRGR